MIPESKWKWYGNAAHFCLSDKCQFHMATEIGDYIISTVGDYFIDGRSEPEEIGLHRKYETFVFKMDGRCECGCGLPKINGSEIDSCAYNMRAAANKGHIKMCSKYARKQA